MDKSIIDAAVSSHFNKLWAKGDPWELDSSPFESAKYDAQLALLINDRARYGRALEIGCAAGVFTHRLAQCCESVVGLDIAEPAIATAREMRSASNIDYQVANIMKWDAELDGNWDLIVMAETLPYLGWLYPFFDVAWLAHRLYHGTCRGGRLLLANTCGGVQDYLLIPSVIRTYRDLFHNSGFVMLKEEVFRGVKHGIEIEAILTLVYRP